MTASTELLEEIHSLFAEQIKYEINMFRAENMPIPAADKAVYAKFLRDNAIFCVPKSEDDLVTLRDRLLGSDRQKAVDELKKQTLMDMESGNY